VGARVLFVTGKGGTGKSCVAAALAREAQRRGRPALLIRMPSSTQVASQEESHVRGAASPNKPRPRLEEKLLDDRRDLEGFLTRVLGLSFLARRLQDSTTFSAVAAAAPGLRDLVALTAITTEAKRRRGVVVVDAPASGHSVPMLTAPSRVRDLAPFGPVAREAGAALALLADPHRFAAVLVTTPEELAVTEILALHGQVADAGVAACHVVVNGLWPAYVSRTDGERISRSKISPDARMHWRRHCRQFELALQLEKKVGRCSHIGFSFCDEGAEAPRADIAAVLDVLDKDAA
jgi:arsenite-transporting ATPase